jgi:hypothetical protein
VLQNSGNFPKSWLEDSGFPANSLHSKLDFWENIGNTGKSIALCSLLQSPYLIPTHAMAVEEANFLVFLSAHVVHTLVRFNISDLGVERSIKTLDS